MLRYCIILKVNKIKNTILNSPHESQSTSNQIHLWKIDINNPQIDLDRLPREILSQDERKRADRLHRNSGCRTTVRISAGWSACSLKIATTTGSVAGATGRRT